ncbi:endolytic transglycosylase MltG [Thermovibrio sp.]
MKRALKLLIPLFITISSLTGGYLFFKRELFFKKEVNLKLEVKRGERIREVLNRLKEEGVIDYPQVAYYYWKFKKLRLRAGCYEFKGELSVSEVLKELQKGSPCLKSFTIIPGETIFDVDRELSREGFCKEGEVLKLSKDESFLKELKIPTLEGFLYPDTYLVNRKASCREVIKVAVKRFHEVFDPIYRSYKPPNLVKEALKNPTPLKLITVASIVEKETALRKERPLVAAVIYNRLIKGMKVQCDPTVIYALRLKGIEREKLTYKDLKVKSPYNTYLVKDLPPTPICQPSLSSIEAALYPAKVKYLYFVANGKGGHTFSKSYNQHLKAVRKYREWQRGS